MGTRSITFVMDEYTNKPIIRLYRQYDGYPSGHGLELAEFLAPYTIVNGLGLRDDRKLANGMGCLAAQLIAHFKTGAGQFYLEVPSLTGDSGQEYEYFVYKDKVRVEGYNENVLFEGTWDAFSEFCKGSDE